MPPIIIIRFQGAEVNHVDGYGATPLIKAASWGFTEVCRILLGNGADITKSTYHGQTALSASLRNGSIDTIKLLLDNGADPNHVNSKKFVTPLISACYNKDVEAMKLLIEKGANVNYPGPHSQALVEFSKNGFIRGVEVLLGAGVNVEVTARRKARMCGHHDIVELLRT